MSWDAELLRLEIAVEFQRIPAARIFAREFSGTVIGPVDFGSALGGKAPGQCKAAWCERMADPGPRGGKDFCTIHRLSTAKRQRRYRAANPKKHVYSDAQKVHRAEVKRRWYRLTVDARKESSKAYYLANREKCIARMSERHRQRRKTQKTRSLP